MKQKQTYFWVWIVCFSILVFVPNSILLNNPTFNLGLGSSQALFQVKDGHLLDYPNKTIGQTFDNALIDEKWETYSTTTGKTAVMVTGRYIEPNGLNYAKPVSVYFLFEDDGTFSFDSVKLGDKYLNIFEINQFIEQVFNYQWDLVIWQPVHQIVLTRGILYNLHFDLKIDVYSQ